MHKSWYNVTIHAGGSMSRKWFAPNKSSHFTNGAFDIHEMCASMKILVVKNHYLQPRWHRTFVIIDPLTTGNNCMVNIKLHFVNILRKNMVPIANGAIGTKEVRYSLQILPPKNHYLRPQLRWKLEISTPWQLGDNSKTSGEKVNIRFKNQLFMGQLLCHKCGEYIHNNLAQDHNYTVYFRSHSAYFISHI